MQIFWKKSLILPNCMFSQTFYPNCKYFYTDIFVITLTSSNSAGIAQNKLVNQNIFLKNNQLIPKWLFMHFCCWMPQVAFLHFCCQMCQSAIINWWSRGVIPILAIPGFWELLLQQPLHYVTHLWWGKRLEPYIRTCGLLWQGRAEWTIEPVLHGLCILWLLH